MTRLPDTAAEPRRASRRRALTLIGATGASALAALLAPTSLGPSAAPAPLTRWRGTALGARASLAIHHPVPAEAARLVRLALNEIERLERVFSLHRADSALSRLNRDGRLTAPPLDLVVLLSRAQAWSELSGARFDATVQPLWRLYRDHFAAPDADPEGPSERAVAAARALVDFRAVEVGPEAIGFARPGMALTLNGIAQGYISDRVAGLLRREGLDHLLVDLGELRALGAHPTGRPWQVGIAKSGAPDETLEVLEVVDCAVATSAARGTVFDRAGRLAAGRAKVCRASPWSRRTPATQMRCRRPC